MRRAKLHGGQGFSQQLSLAAWYHATTPHEACQFKVHVGQGDLFIFQRVFGETADSTGTPLGALNCPPGLEPSHLVPLAYSEEPPETLNYLSSGHIEGALPLR